MIMCGTIGLFYMISVNEKLYLIPHKLRYQVRLHVGTIVKTLIQSTLFIGVGMVCLALSFVKFMIKKSRANSSGRRLTR